MLAIDPLDPWHVVHQGYSVLVTRPDGAIGGVGREGLFDFEARILSRHRLTLGGQLPEYLGGGVPESEQWIARLQVSRPGRDARGPALPQDALGIILRRRLGSGMAEWIEVWNHSMTTVETELALELDADFADLAEVGGAPRRLGEQSERLEPDGGALRIDFHARRDGRELHRGVRIAVERSDSPPAWAGRTLRFPLSLPPHGRWRARLYVSSLVDGVWREPPMGVRDDGRARLRREWRARRARLVGGHRVVGPAFERAAEDLFALRNWEYDAADDAWFPMAGLPSYTGVFGRDALTAAWQGALLGPEMMRGALAIAAATQATADSAWRDEEPGKMIHEMRRGPLAELEIIPQRAYYGTQTTPAMFLLALSECWHWTGDDALLRHHRDAALRTFEWAERYGDRDGDGFLEYVRRSPQGLKNHAWKDSDEAIRYPDGTLVENPIATVEEQAYHCIALQRMAEILVALGEDARADDFAAKASALAARIDAAFWMEDEGFYAMALDAQKRPVRSIGSNPGHALAAGVVPREHARALADRLLAPDLFSGWGVRTLSSEHPAYNPLAYHLGTVWPVENANFALGCKRYGLDDHAERIVAALFSAAGYFAHCRLPEALAGYAREPGMPPSFYPRACSPQAWSASATVQLVQVLLGLYPFAPARLLTLVRPRLPEWLPVLTLRNLRVGDATLTLRFERQKDGSAAHEVIERDGLVAVVEAPPPNDISGEGSWKEAVERRLLEHAPGRLARALRLAIGLDGAPGGG
jgi:glycogen debranching enzyme